MADLPPNIQSVLQKASEDLLANQDACFSVDHTEVDNDDDWKMAYDKNELAEFINFDMLGDEDDNASGFGHLLKNVEPEDITGDGKVIKIKLDSGIGQVVPENYIVLVHYIAYISNLHEPFDVTYIQGRGAKRYTLGACELLPGLEIGIKTMTLGENARFIIKPELAFREMGCPPRIPPNATVLFDVHLVSYMSPDNYISYDKETRDPKRYEKNLIQVKKLHLEGNEQFKLKYFDRAIGKYSRALEMLHITGSNSDVEEIEMMKFLNKLYTNLCLCYLKCCAFNKVCRMCIEALKYSERFSKHNAKLFFYWGKALRLLKDFSEAKKKLQKAKSLEPNNDTIHVEIEKLEKDKVFNNNTKHFTFDDDYEVNNDYKCLPAAFWDVFDSALTEFIGSDDDVLTVTLNKNPDDIELAKRKASLHELHCDIITRAGVHTNCMVIKKNVN